ncbi:MAG: succinate dehydrogenase assembly factor 2 [Thiobacillaceae bacterium]
MVWHSRRGLLELDLWLGNFARHELAQLTRTERGQYEKLLECPDVEIMAMLQGRTKPPAELAKVVLRLLLD